MKINSITLTKKSSIEDIGLVLDRIRNGELSRDLLIELLSERHAIYEERPSYQMNRIKGYALASFAEVGLPDSAVNFLLDELQNGRNAYVVAAAARGLRGTKRPKAQYINFLIQAIANLRFHDDSLDLTQFKPKWPLKNPSSGRFEILSTLKWFRGYAQAALPELNVFLKNTFDFNQDIRQEIQLTINVIEADTRKLDLSCCDVEEKKNTRTAWPWKKAPSIHSIGNLEVQDESGIATLLKNIVDNKITVVAYFYTRCMNPNKCTLTINKMGWLQKELFKKGLQDKVNIIAFTYDPAYDTPARMHAFGENRGMIFGPNAHLLRTNPKDFTILSEFFQLGVSYVASTVNQHRLELYLLDKNGNIRTTYARLQWEIENVIEELETLVNQSPIRKYLLKITSTVQQITLPLLVAFFPKCPFCWAAYLSALGISGIQGIPYSPWLVPIIMAIIMFNLVILYRKSRVRNGMIPFWISLLGALTVALGYVLSNQKIAIPGSMLIFIGALLNSLSYKHWFKVCFLAKSMFSYTNWRITFNKMKN